MNDDIGWGTKNVGGRLDISSFSFTSSHDTLASVDLLQVIPLRYVGMTTILCIIYFYYTLVNSRRGQNYSLMPQVLNRFVNGSSLKKSWAPTTAG